MLTSESNGMEFERFFQRNNRELVRRVATLLELKYRRTLMPILKRGDKIPHIYGTLKVNDITLYGLVREVIYKKQSVDFRMGIFLIMTDLRKQTKIMVTEPGGQDDYSIVYSTHAISRYKERMGLDSDTDFVDVCKHMFAIGRCGSPGIITNMKDVYGTNPDNRVASFTCMGGSFLGYYSLKTQLYYAETFLSTNELREDQDYLNPDKDPLHNQWKETIRRLDEGTLTDLALEQAQAFRGIDFEGGKARILSAAESEEVEKKYAKEVDENPNYFKDQADANRSKAKDRLKRKGYK